MAAHDHADSSRVRGFNKGGEELFSARHLQINQIHPGVPDQTPEKPQVLRGRIACFTAFLTGSHCGNENFIGSRGVSLIHEPRDFKNLIAVPAGIEVIQSQLNSINRRISCQPLHRFKDRLRRASCRRNENAGRALPDPLPLSGDDIGPGNLLFSICC